MAHETCLQIPECLSCKIIFHVKVMYSLHEIVFHVKVMHSLHEIIFHVKVMHLLPPEGKTGLSG